MTSDLWHAGMEECRIAEDEVVLVRREKVYKAYKLRKGKKVHFDKLSFFPDRALGSYFGSQFEVHRQQLVPVHVNETAISGSGVGEEEEECGIDNRAIVDDGSAQALKESDILSLRAQAHGKDVVGTVIEHSTSFRVKTKFSQEKYIKKKKKKHAPVISIIKPSTRALCEMYYSRGPSKICHMRVDTVGQILTYCNVHAHSNMIVMETAQGLLLTAMLERMGGSGSLVQVFFGDFPVRLAVDYSSHLSEKDKAVLLEYPLHRVGAKFPPLIQSSVLRNLEESTSGAGAELVPHEDRTGAELVPHEDRTGAELVPHEDRTGAELVPHEDRIGMDTEPFGTSGAPCGDEETGMECNSEEDSEIADECRPTKRQKIDRDGDETDGEGGRGEEGGGEGGRGGEGGGAGGRGEEGEGEGEGGRGGDGGRGEEGEVGPGKMSTGESTQSSEKGKEMMEGNKEKREQRRREKEERYSAAEQLLMQRKMDGLVLVSRFHPEPLLMSLLGFLAPSRPIVVYCHLLEPLVECYKTLKSGEEFVFDLQISETWTRYYQVLSERTHPMMTMDGQGGYLLTATTINRL